MAAAKNAFKPPPGTCDTHCHVFGPAARFPYSPTRKYTPDDVPQEAVAAAHRALGIERAVFVQASAYGTDHAALLDAIAADPARRRGVAIIDDSFDDKGLRALHEGGVRGARFNFVPHLGGPPPPDLLRRVHDAVRPLGWHLVFHIGPTDLEAIDALLPELSVDIVIDHMARVDAKAGADQPAVKALVELARRPEVWVKVSGAERIAPPPFGLAAPIARALVEASPDRTLWGTDFPHPNPIYPPDDEAVMALIPTYAPAAEAQRRLLVDNPARLYGF